MVFLPLELAAERLALGLGLGREPGLELDHLRAQRLVGGVLRLTLRHPVAARYLLIWFTTLPPDGAGHYAASVSHVQVTGRR